MSKKKHIDLRNGEEVKKYRKSIRLSRVAFWGTFGVLPRTASRYENGDTIINTPLLILLNMSINGMSFEQASLMFIDLGSLFSTAADGIEVHKIITGEKK